MALVEKTHSDMKPLLRGAEALLNERVGRAIMIVALLALACAAVGYAFVHGHWIAAIWSGSALLAWAFLRGASTASNPSPRGRTPRDC